MMQVAMQVDVGVRGGLNNGMIYGVTHASV